MNLRTIPGVTVRAITAALPEQLVTQDDFSELFGTKEVTRIVKGTGIGSIRKAGNLRTSDLILAACRNLLDAKIFLPQEIDALIVVTQTPDTWSPGVGFVVHHELGLPQDCLVIDLSAGCAGYITALLQGSALIASGAYKNVLLCTGDVTTKLIDDKDRHVKMLFGDGASATLLQQGEGIFHFMFGADGSGRAALGTDMEYSNGRDGNASAMIRRLHMDGAAVMNFALAKVPETIKALLDATGMEATSLSLLVMHQANEFMLNYLRRMIGLEAEKVPIDVDGIGNTSSTSIPIVLSRHDAIGTPRAEHVILCGFGVGLSWGALKVDLRRTAVVPPAYVPEALVA